mmetsp:Transcript_13341/g.38068  ORF Transcript_13341/g.38068 Transcript_13341/m.38068 type:complete len:560 (+) Transcript_13341:4352-6031(+)
MIARPLPLMDADTKAAGAFTVQSNAAGGGRSILPPPPPPPPRLPRPPPPPPEGPRWMVWSGRSSGRRQQTSRSRNPSSSALDQTIFLFLLARSSPAVAVLALGVATPGRNPPGLRPIGDAPGRRLPPGVPIPGRRPPGRRGVEDGVLVPTPAPVTGAGISEGLAPLSSGTVGISDEGGGGVLATLLVSLSSGSFSLVAASSLASRRLARLLSDPLAPPAFLASMAAFRSSCLRSSAALRSAASARARSSISLRARAASCLARSSASARARSSISFFFFSSARRFSSASARTFSSAALRAASSSSFFRTAAAPPSAMERFAASRSDSPAAAFRSAPSFLAPPASFSLPDEASAAAAAAARVLAGAGAAPSPDLAGTVDGEGAEEAAGDDFLDVAVEPRSMTFPSLSVILSTFFSLGLTAAAAPAAGPPYLPGPGGGTPTPGMPGCIGLIPPIIIWGGIPPPYPPAPGGPPGCWPCPGCPGCCCCCGGGMGPPGPPGAPGGGIGPTGTMKGMTMPGRPCGGTMTLTGMPWGGTWIISGWPGTAFGGRTTWRVCTGPPGPIC